METVEKVLRLEAELNKEILERREETHTTVLALISRRHHFQVGPPGTGKSMLVSRSVIRIDGLGDQGYFHWLLTKHTVPDELYGPPDLGEMLDNRKFKRNTAFKMPAANIVFLDEIFKGNSAILNANLTMMNERKFFDAEGPRSIDLTAVFAASNELPEGSDLTALYDRFHFHHEVLPLKDTGNWVKMMGMELDPEPDKILSYEDIKTAQGLVHKVRLNDEIDGVMSELKDLLLDEGVEPTDRKWHDSRDIIRAEAWLNGRDVAIVDDLRPLQHVLWDDPVNAKKVSQHVLGMAAPLDREAMDELEGIEGLAMRLRKALRENSDDPVVITNIGMEIHGKMTSADEKAQELKAKFAAMGRTSGLVTELEERIKTLAVTLAKDAFNIPVEQIRQGLERR